MPVRDVGPEAIVPNARGRAGRRCDFDPSDFRSVYAAWFDDVLRWLRALGAPSADHDDLAQEVFVVVHRRLADFDGRNMSAWLYRITANQVRDHRRRHWFRTVLRRATPISEHLEAGGPSPLMALEALDKRQFLDRLLSALSEPVRVTFVLFEVEDYTAEEIAQFQQIPVNTVRDRIQRARKTLVALIMKRKVSRP